MYSRNNKIFGCLLLAAVVATVDHHHLSLSTTGATVQKFVWQLSVQMNWWVVAWVIRSRIVRCLARAPDSPLAASLLLSQCMSRCISRQWSWSLFAAVATAVGDAVLPCDRPSNTTAPVPNS